MAKMTDPNMILNPNIMSNAGKDIELVFHTWRSTLVLVITLPGYVIISNCVIWLR